MAKKREVAIGILIDAQNRLLVGRRMHSPHLGKWEMPGGKVEIGETVIDGLRREWREEGGGELDEIGLWTKIEDPTSILYLFRVYTRDSFIPTIYEEYRFINVDHLLKLDWIETNQGFLEDLRDILTSKSDIVHHSFHPTTLAELQHCLDFISDNAWSRKAFSSFSCTLHADALLYQADPKSTKKIGLMNHEGVVFYATKQPSNLLPNFIKSKERG